MKILVTGGAGFIGSHISEACLAAGHEVVVMDDLSSGHEANVPDGARFLRMDIRSPEAAEAVRSECPDVISHHAAQMNVRRSVEEPGFDADVNIVGFLNLLEAGRQSGLKRVVFASSGGTVYGEPSVIPTGEDQPRVPLCPYGVSKLTGEHYLEYYRQIYGLSYAALRYANVYGPRQDPHGEAGVIAIFAQRYLADDNPNIFGDGKQTRDYVFVGDVVAANLACVDRPEIHGAFNIGTGVETSVVELSDRLRKIIGTEASAQHAEAKDGEVRRSALDFSLTRETLGWSPKVSLDDGLTQTVAFFRSRA